MLGILPQADRSWAIPPETDSACRIWQGRRGASGPAGGGARRVRTGECRSYRKRAVLRLTWWGGVWRVGLTGSGDRGGYQRVPVMRSYTSI